MHYLHLFWNDQDRFPAIPRTFIAYQKHIYFADQAMLCHICTSISMFQLNYDIETWTRNVAGQGSTPKKHNSRLLDTSG